MPHVTFASALAVFTWAMVLPLAAKAGMESRTRFALFVVDGTATKSPKNFAATGELTGRQICTGTAIGSQTVITAAHCVDHGKTAKISLDGKTVKLTCSRHPDYKQTDECASDGDDQCTADIALCKAESVIKIDSSRYEVIQTKADSIKVDADIVMVGYGCTADGKTDHGVLHIAKAKIAKVSAAAPKYPTESFSSQRAAPSCARATAARATSMSKMPVSAS
jgi:hypothetical protein